MPTIRFELDNPGLTSSEALEFIGPTLNVQIGHHPDSQLAVGGSSNLSNGLYPALIDTGARESGIDSTLAEELGLIAEDTERQAAGILGIGAVNVYLARISIPQLGLTVTGHFPGVHLAAGGQPYRALIGRDILRNLTMVYEGRTGVVTLSND